MMDHWAVLGLHNLLSPSSAYDTTTLSMRNLTTSPCIIEKLDTSPLPKKKSLANSSSAGTWAFYLSFFFSSFIEMLQDEEQTKTLESNSTTHLNYRAIV